jgi:hypothetical protein
MSLSRTLLRGLLVAALALALLLAAVATVSGWVGGVGWANWDEPVRIFVDGEQVFGGPRGGSLSFGQALAVALALVFAVVVTLIVVPLAVAFSLAAAALAVVLALVFGLGLPVVILVGLGALLLSPLILLGWLIMKLVD